LSFLRNLQTDTVGYPAYLIVLVLVKAAGELG